MKVLLNTLKWTGIGILLLVVSYIVVVGLLLASGIATWKGF